MLTAAVLLLMSVLLPALIAPPISNLAGVSAEACAPWFFLWVQDLLKWGDPFLLGLAVPLMLIMVPALAPFVLPPPEAHDFGHWFARSNRLARVLPTGISIGVVTFTILGSMPAD